MLEVTFSYDVYVRKLLFEFIESIQTNERICNVNFIEITYCSLLLPIAPQLNLHIIFFKYFSEFKNCNILAKYT